MTTTIRAFEAVATTAGPPPGLSPRMIEVLREVFDELVKVDREASLFTFLLGLRPPKAEERELAEARAAAAASTGNSDSSNHNHISASPSKAYRSAEEKRNAGAKRCSLYALGQSPIFERALLKTIVSFAFDSSSISPRTFIHFLTATDTSTHADKTYVAQHLHTAFKTSTDGRLTFAQFCAWAQENLASVRVRLHMLGYDAELRRQFVPPLLRSPATAQLVEAILRIDDIWLVHGDELSTMQWHTDRKSVVHSLTAAALPHTRAQIAREVAFEVANTAYYGWCALDLFFTSFPDNKEDKPAKQPSISAPPGSALALLEGRGLPQTRTRRLHRETICRMLGYSQQEREWLAQRISSMLGVNVQVEVIRDAEGVVAVYLAIRWKPGKLAPTTLYPIEEAKARAAAAATTAVNDDNNNNNHNHGNSVPRTIDSNGTVIAIEDPSLPSSSSSSPSPFSPRLSPDMCSVLAGEMQCWCRYTRAEMDAFTQEPGKGWRCVECGHPRGAHPAPRQ